MDEYGLSRKLMRYDSWALAASRNEGLIGNGYRRAYRTRPAVTAARLFESVEDLSR